MSGSGRVLARSSVSPGQHQQDQGDSPLVQQELYPSDERHEGQRDTGEPVSNEAAAGIPEAVVDPISDAPPGGELHVEAGAIALEPPVDPSVLFRQRVSIWRDELIAWFKTLASAAVYATLIVTFGFQVARVEGQSMAPTLADQDRLIVNKFA